VVTSKQRIGINTYPFFITILFGSLNIIYYISILNIKININDMENIEVGKRYKSKVNSIAVGCEYEVVKKNKTTCWVKLWEDGTPTKTIYKNIRYSILCN